MDFVPTPYILACRGEGGTEDDNLCTSVVPRLQGTSPYFIRHFFQETGITSLKELEYLSGFFEYLIVENGYKE